MTLRPTRSRVRAVSRDRLEIGGETIRAVRLQVQASGLDTIAWIDEYGQVIRAETPLGLHLEKATREQALACMRRALSEFVIEGVKTTIPLARKIFSHSAFIDGRVDTTFVERTWQAN